MPRGAPGVDGDRTCEASRGNRRIILKEKPFNTAPKTSNSAPHARRILQKGGYPGHSSLHAESNRMWTTAQKNQPLYPKLAHHSSKLGHNHRPLAFQVYALKLLTRRPSSQLPYCYPCWPAIPARLAIKRLPRKAADIAGEHFLKCCCRRTASLKVRSDGFTALCSGGALLLFPCSGDLVTLQSNGPCRVCYGWLWWLIEDTAWTG